MNPDYMRLDYLLSRADQQPLTPEDVQAIQTDFLDMMVDWCEARGLLMQGRMSPAQDADAGLASPLAYRAMVAFLEDYYARTNANDVGALLGDLQLDEGGQPYDPAVPADWEAALVMALSNSGEEKT